jgi:hypothetical protein
MTLRMAVTTKRIMITMMRMIILSKSKILTRWTSHIRASRQRKDLMSTGGGINHNRELSMVVVIPCGVVGLPRYSSYNIILPIFSHAKNTDIFPIYSLYGSETPE